MIPVFGPVVGVSGLRLTALRLPKTQGVIRLLPDSSGAKIWDISLQFKGSYGSPRPAVLLESGATGRAFALKSAHSRLNLEQELTSNGSY